MVIRTLEDPRTMLLNVIVGFERPKVLKISGYDPWLDLPSIMAPAPSRIAAETELSPGCSLSGFITELNEKEMLDDVEVPKLYDISIT